MSAPRPQPRHPLRELFLSRARQFFREPETIFWVYGFPLLMMLGLGLAFRDRGERPFRVRFAASDSARQSALADAFQGRSEVIAEAATLEQALEPASQHGWDLTVLDRDGVLEFQLDRARAESRMAQLVTERILQEAAGRKDPRPARIVELQVPGSRYIDWLIPGLLGLNIMGGGIWGVGFVAVDLRIRKLLKRYRATPMRRSDFLLSLVGGRLIFLFPEIVAILAAGHFIFGLEIAGSSLAVVAVAFIGACSFSGLGLLLATRARTLETISGLMNAAMLPMWLLSGVFFPAEFFPDATQPFVQALPLTQLNNALRGVVLHGHGLADEWLALLILTAWGALSFLLALRWFRWQ